MKISDEHIELMRKQIALDCNVEAGHAIKSDMWIAPTAVLPGSRVIDSLDPFFRIIVFMGKAYIMADEETIDGWEEILKDYSAEWLFRYGTLRKIDHILHEFNREIVDTHIYFLPDMDAPKGYVDPSWKWMDEADIADYREQNIFHDALCYSPTQPDVIAVASVDEAGRYTAMAGASRDGIYTRQIGIDVSQEYRGRGLAVPLVTAIKDRILEQGLLPFYGTSESHALSRIVGTKSGFLPAFSELFVGRCD